MAGVECITLDAESGDEAPQRLNIAVNNADSGFIRCNFCVDPGWLLGDDDPIDHRLRVHARSLFYCDACAYGERGAKGFETIAEVSKHVIKENGLDKTDTKNIHDLIRIPEKPELLKVFRCTFCPGEGLKFVALSEETFLAHVRNRHGLKAPRRRPDKLRRECRVCGEGLTTDEELTRHVTRNHLENGEENRLPFVGFGPRDVIRQDSSESDEFENRRDEVMVLAREHPSGIAKKSRSSSIDWFENKGKGKRKGKEVERRSRSSSSNGSRIRGKGKRKRKRVARQSQSSSSDVSARSKDNGTIKRNRKATQRRSQSSSSDKSRDREREVRKQKDKIKSRSLSTNGSRDRRKEGKRRSRSSSSDGSVEIRKTKKMSRHVKKDDKKWLDETDIFLNKIGTKRKSEKENEKNVDMKNRYELLIKSGLKSKEKGENKHKSAAFEVLDHCNATPKLLKCDLCNEDGIRNMPKHLSRFHQDMTFLCTLCEEVFTNIEKAAFHLESDHDRTGNGKSLLKTGHIQPPSCLLSIICNFCQPTKQIIASSPGIFMYEIFDHMDQHEDQHKGVEKIVNLGADYSCRICTGRVWKDLKSLEAHVNNQHKKAETEDARVRSRSGGVWKDDEDKGFVQREGRQRTRSGDHGRNEDSVAKKKSRSGGWKDEGNKNKEGDLETESWRKATSGDSLTRMDRSSGIRKESENEGRERDVKRGGRRRKRSGETDSSCSPNRESYLKQSYQLYLLQSSLQSCSNKGNYSYKAETSVTGPRQSSMESNLSSNHLDLFQCRKCRVKKEDRYQMMKHMKDGHGLEENLSTLLTHAILPQNLVLVKCNFCGTFEELFDNKRQSFLKSLLRKHQHENHKDIFTSVNGCFNMECRLCSKTFSVNYLQEMANHTARHSGGAASEADVSEPKKNPSETLVRNQEININKHLHNQKMEDDREKDRKRLLGSSRTTKESERKEGADCKPNEKKDDEKAFDVISSGRRGNDRNENAGSRNGERSYGRRSDFDKHRNRGRSGRTKDGDFRRGEGGYGGRGRGTDDFRREGDRHGGRGRGRNDQGRGRGNQGRGRSDRGRGRNDRGRWENDQDWDRKDKERVKESQERGSCNTNLNSASIDPMMETRQMIEHLMQMQSIVSEIVEEIVSNAAATKVSEGIEENVSNAVETKELENKFEKHPYETFNIETEKNTAMTQATQGIEIDKVSNEPNEDGENKQAYYRCPSSKLDNTECKDHSSPPHTKCYTLSSLTYVSSSDHSYSDKGDCHNDGVEDFVIKETFIGTEVEDIEGHSSELDTGNSSGESLDASLTVSEGEKGEEIDTMEKLKERMQKDDNFKLQISSELSKSDVFKNYIEEFSNKGSLNFEDGSKIEEKEELCNKDVATQDSEDEIIQEEIGAEKVDAFNAEEGNNDKTRNVETSAKRCNLDELDADEM